PETARQGMTDETAASAWKSGIGKRHQTLPVHPPQLNVESDPAPVLIVGPALAAVPSRIRYWKTSDMCIVTACRRAAALHSESGSFSRRVAPFADGRLASARQPSVDALHRYASDARNA